MILNIINECQSTELSLFLSFIKQFMNIRTYYVTKDKLKNKYSVKVKSKKRYVNPLVYNKGRILDISSPSKKRFDEFYNSTSFENYVSINIKEED